MSASQTDFNAWVRRFRNRAAGAGISDTVFDAAFQNVTFNADVVAKDRTQAEFSKPIWDYLEAAVSPQRITNGRKALAERGEMLRMIEVAFGVPAEVVTAIWGLESSFGQIRGDISTISALASLAFDGRRAAFFEEQLIAALSILEAGDVDPQTMTGSWAGAMGHTQFMPTTFKEYAIDFDGDGRRDIWSDDPVDALASTANYLARIGWTPEQPWGMEIVLPDGFDVGLTGHPTTKTATEWAGLGLKDITGSPPGDHGAASVILPAGAHGAAFMVFSNFGALKAYNAADAYAIAVGHLADRTAGCPPIQHSWPRATRTLSNAEVRDLQERLTVAGFDTQGADGRIGPNTIAGLRAFQRSVGLPPDGYPTRDVLERLR